MFERAQLAANLYKINILDPKVPEDAPSFFSALDEMVSGERFGLIFYTEGKAGFSEENKRKLTKWFRENKPILKEKCYGYARVNTKTGLLGKLESKAMKLAMPCPYMVTRSQDEALSWLTKLSNK